MTKIEQLQRNLLAVKKYRQTHLVECARRHKNYITRLPEARVFRNAKQRCTNPKNAEYKNYGGRGVQFRLLSIAHLIQLIGRRPSKDHSIDRIDNNGHYEEGNIRWATRSEQAFNRRIWQNG